MNTSALIRTSLLAAAVLLFGCDDSESKKKTDISNEGVSLRIRADLPKDSSSASVAASAYLNGGLRPLVGGDQFYATNGDNEKALRYSEQVPGLYQNNLLSTQPDHTISVDTRFDPEAARAERWYPTDKLSVPASPGKLIGYKASGRFPPAIQISEPVNDTRYQSRSNDIIITWPTADKPYEAQVTLVSTCSSDQSQITATFTDNLKVADSGSYTFPLSTVIPENLTIKESFARGSLFPELYGDLGVALLDILTLNLFNFKEEKPKSFTIERCDIELKLFRTQAGTLGDGVKGGAVVMSRSDAIKLRYQP